jgi:5-methylcytosine-specific restriction endonuclease McrA
MRTRRIIEYTAASSRYRSESWKNDASSIYKRNGIVVVNASSFQMI